MLNVSPLLRLPCAIILVGAHHQAGPRAGHHHRGQPGAGQGHAHPHSVPELRPHADAPPQDRPDRRGTAAHLPWVRPPADGMGPPPLRPSRAPANAQVASANALRRGSMNTARRRRRTSASSARSTRTSSRPTRASTSTSRRSSCKRSPRTCPSVSCRAPCSSPSTGTDRARCASPDAAPDPHPLIEPAEIRVTLAVASRYLANRAVPGTRVSLVGIYSIFQSRGSRVRSSGGGATGPNDVPHRLPLHQ